MGNLQAELTADLRGLRFRDLATDTSVRSHISISAGGTAANFALAAVHHFAAVNVIGQLENDEFGRAASEFLLRRGIKLHCEPLDGSKTPVSIYLRDASSEAAFGVRLVVVDGDGNYRINTETIERRKELITQSDLFYADGYCLMDEPRRSATLHAMLLAHKHGVAVAFDLLPHRAHLHFQLDHLKQWAKSIDVLIAEVRTIRAMFGMGWSDEILDRQAVLETWRTFQKILPDTDAFLQFGADNSDESAICCVGEDPKWRRNGYLVSPDPRGFGDRLAAADLASYVALRRSNPAR